MHALDVEDERHDSPLSRVTSFESRACACVLLACSLAYHAVKLVASLCLSKK